MTSRTLSLSLSWVQSLGNAWRIYCNDKPNPSWNLDYARSLTLDQWTDELNNHFLQKIDREVRTFPFREPVRSIIETLSLENDEYANWYVHSVSFSADSCDFRRQH